jgi:hypothetical protein
VGGTKATTTKIISSFLRSKGSSSITQSRTIGARLAIVVIDGLWNRQVGYRYQGE